MYIKNLEVTDGVLSFDTIKEFEEVLNVLKVVLGEDKKVVFTGVSSEHHLINECSFSMKVSSGDPQKIFEDGLGKAIKKLQSLKIKKK